MDKTQFTDEQIAYAYHPANAFAERMSCAYHADNEEERNRHAKVAVKRVEDALKALGYRIVLEQHRETEAA